MDKMLELAIVIGVIILLLVIVIYEFLKIRKTIKDDGSHLILI